MIAETAERLERIHEPAGPCDAEREKIWTKISALECRIVALETKLVMYSGIGAVLGTLAAQLVLKAFTK